MKTHYPEPCAISQSIERPSEVKLRKSVVLINPISSLNFRTAAGRTTPADLGRFVISGDWKAAGLTAARQAAEHDGGGDGGGSLEDGRRAAALGGDGDDRGPVEIKR